MTRAAHRILNRARSDAWRRVGIPATWKTPEERAEIGKNVAADATNDSGTGRPEAGTTSVTDDKKDG